MAEVRCVDGSVLSVLPVPVLDRTGSPYEVTLRLLRDGAPFGEVGERCGFFLAQTAARLRAARDADPEGFPHSGLEAGLRAWAADRGLDGDAAWSAFERYLPRDRELFAFRSRDPDDLTQAGELRVGLHTQRSWVSSDGPGRGRWLVQARAVLDAWGAHGVGVRAVLDAGQLLALLDDLVAACAGVGAAYDGDAAVPGLRRPVG